jgi:hypothetical protein
LRKILIVAVAALTALAVSAVAIAQTQSATLTTTVSPKKAGTKKKPASTDLYFKVVNGNPNATLRDLEIVTPGTLTLSGKGFPKCAEQGIIDDDCPKGSQVGTGTASAILGVNNPPDKARTPLTFKIKAFVTGAKGISFRLAANEIPTLVVVSPGKLTKSGHKLSIHVPESAQSPDGVTYAGLQDIISTIGGKHKKNKLVQASGCKKKQHLLNTKLFFRNNGADAGGVATASDGAPCKK